MKNKAKRISLHLLLTLLVILSLGFVFAQRNTPSLQFYLLLAADLIYLTWALVYHRQNKSLTLATYLEYLLTAILAAVLVAGLFI